ncbi:MAG: phosphoribosyltransferase [Aigarchaeota archaeon]|nr:phosphoribosyltransferase [Aigarchaeota archaeon]MDW8092343.1 phosphoribosyltransferase [Nitrososphaerota archaeon]
MRDDTIGKVRLLILEWRDVTDLIDELGERIEGSYRFDVMLGILRGGMIVANLLSDALFIDEVYPIGIRSYVGMGKRSRMRVYHWPYLRKLRGKRVLIVDDVADHGKTMMFAVERIKRTSRPSEVRTATIHVKPWSKFIPTYYSSVTSAWILYPWSRYENVVVVGRELLRTVGLDQAVEALSDLQGMEREKVKGLLTRA